MRFVIQTEVQQPLEEVWHRFDQDLFQKLNPPFPPVKLLRFDGSQTGDTVALELNFLLFRQKWVSQVTEQYSKGSEIVFVDKGVLLPFFLKSWKHRHGLQKAASGGTIVIDDITFSAPLPLLDILLFPLLYLQFIYRKPIYRRVFSL